MAGGLLSLPVVEMLPLQPTPDTLSGVKSTRLYGEFHERCKLILRTGFSPGGAAVTMDLGGTWSALPSGPAPGGELLRGGGRSPLPGSGNTSSGIFLESGLAVPPPSAVPAASLRDREGHPREAPCPLREREQLPAVVPGHGPFTSNLKFGDVGAEWRDGDAGGFVEFPVVLFEGHLAYPPVGADPRGDPRRS